MKNEIEGLGVAQIRGISGFFDAVALQQRRNGPVERSVQYQFGKVMNDTQATAYNMAMSESVKGAQDLRQKLKEAQKAQTDPPPNAENSSSGDDPSLKPQSSTNLDAGSYRAQVKRFSLSESLQKGDDDPGARPTVAPSASARSNAISAYQNSDAQDTQSTSSLPTTYL